MSLEALNLKELEWKISHLDGVLWSDIRRFSVFEQSGSLRMYTSSKLIVYYLNN